MKTIALSDEIVKELEQISAQLGISVEEIIERGISEYIQELKSRTESGFEAIGFGMWAERSDMKNSVEWVSRLREQQWNKS